MKRLITALGVAIFATLGLGSAAAAYPPDGPSLILAPATVAPDGTFTATLEGCTLGDSVTVTVEGDSATATCGGPVGSSRGLAAPGESVATVTLNAPTTPGTYTVTATAAPSGAAATATLTVVAPAGGGGGGTGGGGGQLPSTGSSNVPIAQIAAGTLLAGLALTGVAMYRRRSRAAA